MQAKSKLMILTIVFACSSFSFADTFKHKESGETFTGFATQKTTAGKTLIYNDDEGKMMPVLLDDYEITSDSKGRRNTVSLLLLDEPDVFISEAVSEKAAALIINASNKGPQAIILQINSPGGRGASMRTIADAILKTDNCPVIAYISEGAYSAAAVVALSCDKVYIDSAAGIGAVGSAIGQFSRNLDYSEYLSIYTSDFQLNDYLYTKILSQKSGRQELLIRALIDKSIAVIEVANIDGSRSFVENKDRQATQTLIRTLCEGMPQSESEDVAPADIIGKVLNLSAEEAVELKLADGTAETVPDILEGLELSDAKITPVPGIEKVVKKFTSARRNISDSLFRIEQYEQDIQTLSEQFTTIDNQLRTGIEIRGSIQGDPGYRSSRRRQFSSDYNQEGGGIARNRERKNRDRGMSARSEAVITEEPRVDIEIIYTQLTRTLEDVVAEYRRVLKLVDRWPNGLPPKVTRGMLQKDMDTATAELDRLYRYQPVYPTQNQSQVSPRRSTNRRQY